MMREAVFVDRSMRAPLTDPSEPVPTVPLEVSLSASGEIAITASSLSSVVNALTASTMVPCVS